MVSEGNANKEHWWSDTQEGKLKYSEKNLAHCHCIQHHSHLTVSLKLWLCETGA